MSPSPNYCEQCGAELGGRGGPCPDCGHEPSSKSAALAALLSVLLTGLGQLYLGQFARGAAWFLGAITVTTLLAVAAPEAAVIGFIFPIGAAIDAYAQASATGRTVG